MVKKPSLAALEQQIADLTDALQRERADAMNVRRRSEEERAGLASFYKALVISQLLPVLDNFERAIKHVPKANRQETTDKRQEEDKKLLEWIGGVNSIVKQFEDALQKIGVKRIKTVGEPFDPNLHEAVTMEEGEGTKEVVSEELQAGYVLGDTVVRHAMVRVKTM